MAQCSDDSSSKSLFNHITFFPNVDLESRGIASVSISKHPHYVNPCFMGFIGMYSFNVDLPFSEGAGFTAVRLPGQVTCGVHGKLMGGVKYCPSS